MSISFEILGEPGMDNAAFVRVDSGQSVERLLFDCGEGCVARLPLAETQLIDHLFFSHLHMDHVAGFDSFFRAAYDRTLKPNAIWGPPRTAEILQGRMRGYMWNLCEGVPGTWRVNDISAAEVRTTRFELAESFSTAHAEGARPFQRTILDTPAYSVDAVTLNHHTPSLAYIVREKARSNVDAEKMNALGLKPGPWLKQLKDPAAAGTVTIDGASHSIIELRAKLLVETPGDSVAYLTDFMLDDAARADLVPALRGVRTAVCESQYRHADVDLAVRNFHMTSVQVAEIAKAAGLTELILFHVSQRYTPLEWAAMLAEARAIFPNTRYPSQWKLP